jgi:uridine phosphorylase
MNPSRNGHRVSTLVLRSQRLIAVFSPCYRFRTYVTVTLVRAEIDGMSPDRISQAGTDWASFGIAKMLRELTRDDWLSILGIPSTMVPQALVLRGTRNLKTQYDSYKQLFGDVLEVGTPNGVLEDVLIGTVGGVRVAYASVYGAPMASEVVHLFGVLGTSLVVQIGCCGALADGIDPGDLFIAEEAYCGDGASQYYKSDGTTVTATLSPSKLALLQPDDVPCHTGRIYTTAALFAEGQRELDEWHFQGYAAVDMESAATFAVAEHFGMDRVSILFAFDNPRHAGHLLLDEAHKIERRAKGNRRMNDLAFELIRRSLVGNQSSGIE